MRTIGDIPYLGARRYGNQEAVVMGDTRLSFIDLDDRSTRIASALISRGIRPGDRVAIMSENSVEVIEAFFGIVKAGAVAVMMNFRYGALELRHVLTDTSPALIFTSGKYIESIHAALAEIGHDTATIGLDGEGQESMAGMRQAELSSPLPDVDPASAAMILFTSGTTGRPKAVVTTHDADMRLLPFFGIEGDLGPRDVVLVCMPLFHGAGLVIQTLSALYFGAKVVVNGASFIPAEVLQTFEDEGVTLTLWAPTLLAMLTASDPSDTALIERPIKIWYGSSSITERVFADARQAFPAARFYQLYGSTESTIAAVLRPEEHDSHPGATGRAILGADVRIVDSEGNLVEPGAVGHLLIRSPMLMHSYFGNPEATAETLQNGWLHSGDFALAGEAGFFTIVGRASDRIVTGGENVYPDEVEGVLVEHPAVGEVSVFGVADHTYGQRVAVAVVPLGDTVPTLEELQGFAATSIARYKLPRTLLILQSLPRNASGKVLRRSLIEMAEAKAKAGMNADGESPWKS